MTDIPVDRAARDDEPASTTAAVEREITKRRLIEAVTSVVLVVLYMVFTVVRERAPGVVALQPADDWDEGGAPR